MKTRETLRIVLSASSANGPVLRQRILRIAPSVVEVVVCESVRHLRDITRFNDYHAVLLDWTRDAGGEAVVEAVKACPLIPVIVVSREPEAQHSERLLRLGAQDYLVKRETQGGQLVRAIHHAMERKRLDIRLKTTLGELGQANARLRSLALRDTLTGALNRRAFFAIGGQALARARRDGRAVALLYCDLDRFKQINDTLGHAVGDAVLKAFCERCGTILRRSDSLARLGGDEFVILMDPVADRAAALDTARRLRSAFDAPLDARGERVALVPSIGVALFPECEDMETLVGNADRAMYVAKRGPGIACLEAVGAAATAS